jgi:cation:H+ antiporter
LADLALSITAVLVGLVLLEIGADRFTDAIGSLARRLHASEATVGLLTAGGEWEELVVVVLAIVGGHPSVAVGNVVGSCMANLIGSMPLGMLGRRPLIPDRSARVYGVVMLGTTALAALLSLGGHVTHLSGGVLVGVFVAYVVSVVLVIRRGWLRPPIDEDDEDEVGEGASLARVQARLALGLVLISAGAEAVVFGAVHIAQVAGLSEYAIGATVVAVATTLPDKAISLIAGSRGQSGVVTANALGSNIFLLTLVLGLGALATSSGLVVPESIIRIDMPLLLAASAVVVVVLFLRARLHRGTGAVLLVGYVAYIVFALIRG